MNKHEAFKKAYDEYPSQDNEGYIPERGSFKCGFLMGWDAQEVNVQFYKECAIEKEQMFLEESERTTKLETELSKWTGGGFGKFMNQQNAELREQRANLTKKLETLEILNSKLIKLGLESAEYADKRYNELKDASQDVLWAYDKPKRNLRKAILELRKIITPDERQLEKNKD